MGKLLSPRPPKSRWKRPQRRSSGIPSAHHAFSLIVSVQESPSHWLLVVLQMCTGRSTVEHISVRRADERFDREMVNLIGKSTGQTQKTTTTALQRHPGCPPCILAHFFSPTLPGLVAISGTADERGACHRPADQRAAS